ncbi:MAG: hypothetical protein ACRD00_02010 [Thermoanaerobaculia bacterium]
MILFEEAALPAVRAGEFDLGGRRVAARATPYGGDAAPPSFRFDPLERRFLTCRRDSTVSAGPAEADLWRGALEGLPPGAVAVEKWSGAEAVRGAYRAAVDGALQAGRGVFLLDPEPEGLPDAADSSAVVVVCFRPGPLPKVLSAAARAGFASGLALPVIPGWTAEASFYEPLLEAASAAGAVFVAPLSPASDGEARRCAVEARAADDPASADGFFERVHHGDWLGELPGRLAAVRAAAVARGLLVLPPRPRGAGEPPANAAASSLLEQRAAQMGADEHRQALMHAAVRWIDESGRDLSALTREGNFRKVFPFGAEVAVEVEAALRGPR